MNRKNRFFISVFTLAGLFLIFTIGCEEDAERSFKLTTSSITILSDSTALSGGSKIAGQNIELDSLGLIWSTSSDPTLEDSVGKTTIKGGTSSFADTITGLSNNTKYYVKAYGIDSLDTPGNADIYYGDQVIFTSINQGDGVTDIDGNKYKTVIIGEQEWMAENLKTTKYNDGSDIVNVTKDKDWSNSSSGAYAWYNNDNKKGDKHGALYNWYAVETDKLCPDGWHVPSDDEWNKLIDYAGNNQNAAIALKSPDGWAEEENGTNIYGFNALPSGNRHYEGSYNTMGYDATWWTSGEHSSNEAFARFMKYYDNDVTSINYDKNYGFSVRCLKD